MFIYPVTPAPRTARTRAGAPAPAAYPPRLRIGLRIGLQYIIRSML